MSGHPSYSYRGHLRPMDILCQAACLAVSTVVIVIRTYTKFFLTRSASWEDYTALVAWAGLIGYAAIAFEADKVGSGIHQDQVAPEDLMKYAQFANASQIMYGPLIFITKLSILLLYLRVFAPSRKGWTYILIHLLLWFNAAFYLADTIVEIAACIPRERIWNPNVPGHCVNIDVLILATAIINSTSDISLLLLPIFAVWRLHLRTSQKLGISAIFTAGLFGCFASIMRLAISIKTNHTKDRTSDWFPEFLWTSAEICAGIIASCLPAVPSFFRHVGRKAATALSSSNINASRSSRNRHTASSKSQPWGSNSSKRPGWVRNGESISRSEYRELDEIATGPGWRADQAPHTLCSQVTAGANTSTSASGTSQEGILKTVHVDIEEEAR